MEHLNLSYSIEISSIKLSQVLAFDLEQSMNDYKMKYFPCPALPNTKKVFSSQFSSYIPAEIAESSISSHPPPSSCSSNIPFLTILTSPDIHWRSL